MKKSERQKQQKQSRRIKLYQPMALLFCLLFLLSVLPVSVKAAEVLPGEEQEQQENSADSAPGAASRVVRVGWYEDSYHITGANGTRSGYAYEYEQAVAAYTGWTYEYVKGDWSELLGMLQAGEIDMMSALSYTDERAETMLFSELPMGEEKYYLYADLANTDISASDLSTLNDKRVVVMEKSVQATQFYEWEELHNVKTRHINMDSFEDARVCALAHEIDGVISTETPAWVEAGMSAIATTGGSDIYYGINKNRPDLKEELDRAMRTMESDNPFYADDLYQKYLSAQSVAVLSSEEKDWLQRKGSIRIGLLNHDTGVSVFDEASGEVVGIISDYIEYASGCLGNVDLKFELIGFDSQEEQIRALQEDQIDMIFHASQNPYAAEQNGMALSNTVWTYNLAAITAKNYFDENEANHVAIAKDDRILEWYLSYYYPQWEIQHFDSFGEAVDAVSGGQADCFVVTSSQVPQYIKENQLHSVFLMKAENVSFGVRRGNSTLISILNKTLKAMPSSRLTGALSVYDNTSQRVTFLDFIKDNLLIVTTASILFLLFILMVILGFLHKARKAEVKARQEADRSQELNKKLQESQKNLEEALVQAESANSAKTVFLNNMSHDIRTPMNAIIGFTSLAAAHMDDRELVKDYLQKIGTSSEHLLSLINDVLDMSRIESGKVKLEEAPVHLPELLQDIQTMIRPSLDAKHLEFQMETIDVRDTDIIADKLRLTQILLNILSNAVKYNKNGGKIWLRIQQEKESSVGCARYHFVVKDTGIGISREFQKHIFENFSREETATVSGIQGTGLGLAITKRIVNMMGGTISLESEEGVGSEFDVCLTFRLSVEKAAVSKADLPLPELSSLAGKRILLVEDNELNQEIAHELLTEAGFLVEIAGNGAAAVKRMELSVPGEFDLILMDIQMPVMDGYEATRQIRAMKKSDCSRIPIIAMTANAFDDDRALAMQAGMNGYLTKPIKIDEMLAAIRTIL